MKNIYCRLNLSLNEFEILDAYVTTIIDEIEYRDGGCEMSDKEDINVLRNILKNVKHIKVSNKKFEAPKKANLSKISKSRAQIKKAYQDLKAENKKITVYSIAKEAKVAHSTAAKYIDIFKEDLI